MVIFDTLNEKTLSQKYNVAHLKSKNRNLIGCVANGINLVLYDQRTRNYRVSWNLRQKSQITKFQITKFVGFLFVLEYEEGIEHAMCCGVRPCSLCASCAMWRVCARCVYGAASCVTATAPLWIAHSATVSWRSVRANVKLFNTLLEFDIPLNLQLHRHCYVILCLGVVSFFLADVVCTGTVLER